MYFIHFRCVSITCQNACVTLQLQQFMDLLLFSIRIFHLSTEEICPNHIFHLSPSCPSPYIPLLGFWLNFLLASRHHPDSPVWTNERTKCASQERNRESNSPNSTAMQTPLLSRSVSPASSVSAENWPCRIFIPHFVWIFFSRQDRSFSFCRYRPGVVA